MSCGGLQTLEIAPDPRVTTAVICNSGILGTPGSGMPGMPNLTKDHLLKLHTPALYILGGEKDIAYANVMDDFRRINHERCSPAIHAAWQKIQDGRLRRRILIKKSITNGPKKPRLNN
jgi:hypothetical protein